MSTSCRRSSGPVLQFPRSRSSSLSGGGCGGAFASPPSSASLPSDFDCHQHSRRPSSPTRVHIAGSSKAPGVCFSLGRRPASSHVRFPAAPARRTCMCSPTNHPGSFRCRLHKQRNPIGSASSSSSSTSTSMRLNMRRSAMTNSLVRIGTVEGDLVKRALAALIRPSSHQQRRRADFRLRPSRLSVMSKKDDQR